MPVSRFFARPREKDPAYKGGGYSPCAKRAAARIFPAANDVFTRSSPTGSAAGAVLRGTFPASPERQEAVPGGDRPRIFIKKRKKSCAGTFLGKRSRHSGFPVAPLNVRSVKKPFAASVFRGTASPVRSARRAFVRAPRASAFFAVLVSGGSPLSFLFRRRRRVSPRSADFRILSYPLRRRSL